MRVCVYVLVCVNDFKFYVLIKVRSKYRGKDRSLFQIHQRLLSADIKKKMSRPADPVSGVLIVLSDCLQISWVFCLSETSKRECTLLFISSSLIWP